MEESKSIFEKWASGEIVGAEVEVADTGERRKVLSKYENVRGAVYLDNPVQGLRSWNIDELRIIEK